MRRATWALLRKELVELRRSRRFVLLVALQLVVAVGSLLVAARAWRDHRDVSSAFTQLNAQRLAALTSWSDLAETGVMVHPAHPSGRFLVDLRPWPGFLVTSTALPLPIGWEAQASAPAPAQVVLFFFPLLALLLTFDSIALERSRRTLGLLVSWVGSRQRVFLIKLGARAIVVGVCSAAAIVGAGGVTAAFAPEFARDPTFWPTLLALAVAGTVLGVVFASIGAASSAATPEPATALLACVGMWVFLLVALPQALAGLSRILVPYPERALLDASAASLHAESRRTFEEKSLEPMRQWLREGPPGQARFEATMNELRRETYEELHRRLGELFAAYLRRRALAAAAEGWASRWLPGGLLAGAMESVAGCGDGSLHRYLERVVAYAAQLARTVESKQGAVEYTMPFDQDPHRTRRPDPADLPTFPQPLPESAGVSLLVALSGLAAWSAVAVAVGVVVMARVPLR